jgi:PAS domain S-box-containing protein
VYTVEIKQGKCASTRHGEGSFAVTGYRPEEYAQDQDLWINMILEEDRPKVLQAIDSLLADKSSVSLEHRIKRKDGAIRWLSATLVPRIDRNGQLIFYDGLISDITSRKETERLDERHQQQLLLMDKMASLGILVSGVAHEINNPNNYMMLNAKILSKAWNEVLPVLDSHFAGQSQASMAGLPYEEARTLLPGIMKGMLDGTNRIKHIVDSLRSYSREDTSQLRQNVDLNRAVESALTLVSSLVRKTTDFLEVRCDNSLPTIKGSQQQIEQVIINLLTNACHALRNRSDRIEVRTSSDECAIILQVIDTGVGIAEGDILKITEPFFTTRRDLGGTGLGLSVSSNIIKNHGGTIAFASELGKGTTVTVRLPREQK